MASDVPFDIERISEIKVHPGIGMARVGNSDMYFIGPEAPGIAVNPGGEGGPGPGGGTYRDEQGCLKRQAQRFRVYAYDAEGNVLGELTVGGNGVKAMRWQVHARNVKAANYAFQGAYLFDPTKYRNPTIQGDAAGPEDRDKLIIDAGVQTIQADLLSDGTCGKPATVVLKGDIFDDVTVELPGYLKYADGGPDDPSKPRQVTYRKATDIEIGRLDTDSQGRLLFVASPGKSECVTTPKIELSNPSEKYNPPNGPDEDDPLINQFAYFNVPGWWDDTCGASIDVTLQLEDGGVLSTRDGVGSLDDIGIRNARRGASVVTAPPKYAPHMYHVVSLLDRVYEAFPESYPDQGKPTEFYRDIYPIFERACNYGWVSAQAAGVDPSTRNLAHGPRQAGNLLSPANMQAFTDTSQAGYAARKQIYNIMRYAEPAPSAPSDVSSKLLDTLPVEPPPAAAPAPRKQGEGPVSRGNAMPKLWGTGGKPLQNEQLGNNLPNQYLSLTDWQLERMSDWAAGNFTVGTLQTPKELEDLPIAEQPAAMDAAALEPTIGGGFHPGIEFPYLICYPQVFETAFRIAADREPGSVAAYMSSPWQGDYWSCNTAWWPVQRPDIIFDYDSGTKERTYKDWFRGCDADGNPLSQTDGYNQMVDAWPKLGMVLPQTNGSDKPLTDDGEVVFTEFERDESLDCPPKTRKS